MATINLVTPIGVISYPTLWKPKAIEPGKPPKFSAVLILPPEKLQPVRDAILAAAKSEWGEEALELLRGQRLSQPLRSGAEKGDDPVYKDKWFFNAYSEQAPMVMKYLGPENSVPLTDQSEMYAGCLVRLNVGFFSYKSPMKKGVGCGLNGVELIAPGTRIDGRQNAAAAFGKAVDPEAEALRQAAAAQAEQGKAQPGPNPGAGAAGSPW